MNLFEYAESYQKWLGTAIDFWKTFWKLYLKKVKEMTNG